MKEYPVKRAAVRDENGVVRTVKLGGDGGGAGRRTFRGVIVGTSTAGWTDADCDFLCDGYIDAVTWRDIFSKVSTDGGQILFLDGEYDFQSTIDIKERTVPITLSGCGEGTILKIKAGTGSISILKTKKITVQNMTIIEKGESDIGAAISVHASNDITIRNVTIKGYTGYAIDISRWTGTQNANNIIIEDCKIDTKYSAIRIIGVDNCCICRNIITISEVIEGKAGVIHNSTYKGSEYCPSHNIIISENIITSMKQQTSDRAVGVEATENCIVKNNSMRNLAYFIPKGTIISNCIICGNILIGAIAERHPSNAMQESVIFENNLTVLRTEEEG